MEQEHIEDSIDDLISLLNFQKTPMTKPANPNNIKIERDVYELGNLLNATNMGAHSKAISIGSSSTTQKLTNKPPIPFGKPQDKIQSKGDFISRNFLNSTPTYMESRTSFKESENRGEQEEINLTEHSKVATMNSIVRYLRFQPMLKDINERPKTPPDHGYYFKFNISDVKLIKYLLEENGFRETNNSNSFSIMWSNGAIKNEIYQSLGHYQKVNHFPRSQEMTRKDLMHRNISKMQTTFGLKNFNFIPKSFILPNEMPLLESVNEFLSILKSNLSKDAQKNKGQWYIVKPQASSQGRGIFITDKIEEIAPKQSHQIIVSHYLNDPFLINGLKFDLRVYVALTCVNPLRIYIYQEGLVRFATVPYSRDPESYINRFVHLTNYSINKKSDTFVQNEDNGEDEESCSKWSFATFKAYLDSHGIDHRHVFQNIEDLVVKTILSVENIVFTASATQLANRNNCFELFGFDIMLDSRLKPWLLEVNLSPSLACEAALDLKIKSELISDLFNLAGVVPLHQRTITENTSFGKNPALLNYGVNVPNFDKKPGSVSVYGDVKSVDNLTKEERAVIKETNEEWERRGKFKRIYPAANVNDYRGYFENERPLNTLLRNVVLQNLKKGRQEIPRAFQSLKKFNQ